MKYFACMRLGILFFLLITVLHARSTDSAQLTDNLKGYKKLFYTLVTKHPRINSPLERALLRHYLAGSGTTVLLTDDVFVQLQKVVRKKVSSSCVPLKTDTALCSGHVVLDDDPYFGWALGTITCVYTRQTNQLLTFADVYDFNKKKKGQRNLKSEIVTRIFRLIAPRSAKAFIVSYGTAAYSAVPL